MKIFFLAIALTLCISGCKNKEEPLPFYGNQSERDGKIQHHKIRPFKYLNQDSTWVSNESLSQGIYIADFFFTSCPSICPKVKKQMLRLHDHFKNNEKVKLVSFTIDPKRDDVTKLSTYAQNLGVTSKNWHFLTGDKFNTLELAKDFLVSAFEAEDAPGGFDHSGMLILVDKNGHIRANAEGTDPESIDPFIKKIELLLAKE
jgi:protein SCO1/2